MIDKYLTDNGTSVTVNVEAVADELPVAAVPVILATVDAPTTYGELKSTIYWVTYAALKGQEPIAAAFLESAIGKETWEELCRISY